MARKITSMQGFLLAILLSSCAIIARLSAHRAQNNLRAATTYARHRWTTATSAVTRRSSGSTKVLIRSGGIPREGFGSAISFLKDAASIAHVLGADLRIPQSDPIFGYRTSELIHADTLETHRGGAPQRICDLHQTVLHDLTHGTFDDRYNRAASELNALRERVEDYCLSNATLTTDGEPFVLPPHVQQRLETCDVIIWADQVLATRAGWNNCNLAWLRKSLDVPDRGSKKRTIGVHYRWGDVWHHEHLDPKWAFNQRHVETILAAIRACDRSFDVRIYMQAGRPGETPAEQLKQLAPIRSFDSVVDTGDDIKDLLDLASRDILIVNSGMYSEVAAAISSARLVLHNGFFPHFFDYLRKYGTTVMTIAEAAKRKDLCHLLHDLDQ